MDLSKLVILGYNRNGFKDEALSLPGKEIVVYLESRGLYIDFMLNKFSREEFIDHIAALPPSERDALFNMSKMQIFRLIYEQRNQDQVQLYQASA